jgi:N-acetyl-alpha-D-muramate 1-phosphate uridylyltransferase
MKVMILAAGEGRRMLPLTATVPKPLLCVADKPLIVHQIEKLARGGLTDIVINHAYLGEQIVARLGDGTQYGVQLSYSPEPAPLETAGGIIQALPLLGDAPFALVNADIWTDYVFAELPGVLPDGCLGHLVMVDNRTHHPQGDFALAADGLLLLASQQQGRQSLTYSGISVFSPKFFMGLTPGFRPLRPLLEAAIAKGQLRGSHFRGTWMDIGTPARLEALDCLLRQSATSTSGE